MLYKKFNILSWSRLIVGYLFYSIFVCFSLVNKFMAIGTLIKYQLWEGMTRQMPLTLQIGNRMNLFFSTGL